MRIKEEAKRIGEAIVDVADIILLDERLDFFVLLGVIFTLGLFTGYLYFRFQ